MRFPFPPNGPQVLYMIGLAIESTRQGRASSMPPPQRAAKFGSAHLRTWPQFDCELVSYNTICMEGYRTIL